MRNDDELDNTAKLLADAVACGAKVTFGVPAFRKCGTEERYRYNGSPNWMNRWTCPKCGRHESR